MFTIWLCISCVVLIWQALQTESEKLASRLIRLLFSDCRKCRARQSHRVPPSALTEDPLQLKHVEMSLPTSRHCVSPRITDGDSPKVLEIDLNVVRSLCADGIPDEAKDLGDRTLLTSSFDAFSSFSQFFCCLQKRLCVSLFMYVYITLYIYIYIYFKLVYIYVICLLFF